ncbi:MAG TPA: ABC transporter substrate-binding protein [Planctomycetota bacterium]|nr:ABC transporter substrate-binding protein [Planctomycetota bacterium]
MKYSVFCSLIIFFLVISISAQQEDTLIYGDFSYPDTFAPIQDGKSSEYRISQLIFDSLLSTTVEGNFVYSLAKDMDVSPDGLSYTFLLQDNIQWHDSTPLTSKDVEFTIRLLTNPKTYHYDTTLEEYVEDITCLNASILTITLRKPFYNPLTLFTFKIFPRHKFSDPILSVDHPFHKKPLGCGPFQIEKETKQSIEFIASPSFHHRGKPHLKKIVVRFYSNREDAWVDLKNQKIHLVAEAPIQREKTLPSNIVLEKYSLNNIHILAFNHHKEHELYNLFQSKKFRSILLRSIHREKILSSCFGKEGTLLTGPFPNHYLEKPSDFPIQPYNVEYAMNQLEDFLLAKDYTKNKNYYEFKGRKLTLRLVYEGGDPFKEQACQEIAQSLEKLGLIIKLEKQTETQFKKNIFQNHNFDLVYYTYTFTKNSDAFFLLQKPPKTQHHPKNFSGYFSTQLEELIYQFQNSFNPWMIQKYSQKIHKFAYDETIHLFLWELNSYVAYREKLKNFQLHPYYLFNFAERWKIF